MSTTAPLCLVLGPEGSGKTLFLRKLRGKCSKRSRNSGVAKESDQENIVIISSKEENQTIPTVGTNIEKVQLSSNVSCTLKEYGGQMIPVWSNAYKDSSMVIYIIDSSNSLQLSVSTIALLDLLSTETLKGKPVLVFFNKTDLPLRMPLVEYKSVMRLEDIVAHAQQSIEVVEGSCWSGVGLEAVEKWIDYNLHS